MKKLSILLLALTMTLTVALSGCGNKGGDSSSSVPGDGSVTVNEVAAGYMRYDITESSGVTEGFGTQFDTLIVEPENQLTDEEWQLQVEALKTMNLQNVRIRFFPESFERRNDNDDYSVFDYDSPGVNFNSREMRNLYRILDAFQANGVKVDLSWYGCRVTATSQDDDIYGSWLGGVYGEDGVNGWCIPPRLTDHPNEEFAEAVVAGMNYLINEKGYTCINEYSLFPEPDGCFSGGNIDQFFAICELVKVGLDKIGLRDKLIFSGPADYGNNPERYESYYLSKTEFDKATSSVYPFNNQTPDLAMLDFALQYGEICKKYGLTWGIAECGTSNFINPVTNSDTETYDRALFMAKFFVNMVNGGCTNIKYFVFSDCYYDGTLNTLGLFKFRHEGFKAKPVWYTWSLLCRYTDIGSEIFPVTNTLDETRDPDVSIVAFKLPDGSWTYVATNASSSSKKVALVNGRADRADKLNLYKVSGSLIPEDRSLTLIPASGEVDTSTGVAYFTVPANGFVVLSNKQ